MKLVEITDANFEDEVLNAKVPVLVDFWASWCGPCKALAPILEQAADHYGDKVKIVKLNTEVNRRIPEQFGIKSIPTLLLFKDGAMVDAMVGMRPPDQLKSMIDRVVNPGFFARLRQKFSGE